MTLTLAAQAAAAAAASVTVAHDCFFSFFSFFFFQFDLRESTRIIMGIRIKDLDLWREVVVAVGGGVPAIIMPSVVSGQRG